MTALTRRQTLIGAAATVVTAALPAVAIANVVPSAYPHYRNTYVRHDGQWPDGAIDGDLFEDVLHNVRWQYCTGGYPGWFFVDKIDWSKPCLDGVKIDG
jgi:hypothetical protein